jgi:hypothetical protein
MTPAACPSATRPLPAHGTPARYRGLPRHGIKGCRCTDCRIADRRYRKHLRVRRRKVDATTARTHIDMLLKGGASYNSIARAATCAVNTVRWIHKGVWTEIRTGVRDGILGVRPAADPHLSVNAQGSIRRVQALMAIGWPISDIRDAAGLGHAALSRLASGVAVDVRASTAAAIADAYRRLSAADGGSVMSRNRAAREGWPTPAQWDGEIDNPAADPAAWARDAAVRRRVEDVVADAEELHAEHGVSWEAAAAQVGVLVNTLHTYRIRVRERAAAAGGAS